MCLRVRGLHKTSIHDRREGSLLWRDKNQNPLEHNKVQFVNFTIDVVQARKLNITWS